MDGKKNEKKKRVATSFTPLRVSLHQIDILCATSNTAHIAYSLEHKKKKPIIITITITVIGIIKNQNQRLEPKPWASLRTLVGPGFLAGAHFPGIQPGHGLSIILPRKKKKKRDKS